MITTKDVIHRPAHPQGVTSAAPGHSPGSGVRCRQRGVGSEVLEASEGLQGIEPGGRVVVIFHLHHSPRFSAGLRRQASGQTGRETGVFGTCSPVRPNPVGMSVLEVPGSGARA